MLVAHRPRHEITLLTHDGVPAGVVDSVAYNISLLYGVRVKTITATVTPANSYLITHDAYDASMITRYLYKIQRKRVIGITANRIISNFKPMYGLSLRNRTSCVVSIADMDSTKLPSEASKVALHEIGHTFGLNHCKDPYCYMSAGSGTTLSIDSGAYMCNTCRKKLKL